MRDVPLFLLGGLIAGRKPAVLLGHEIILAGRPIGQKTGDMPSLQSAKQPGGSNHP